MCYHRRNHSFNRRLSLRADELRKEQIVRYLIGVLFGCAHKATTWPRTDKRTGQTHVACLDCGKDLAYDWKGLGK